jgi:hypothetical protein
MPFLLMFFSIDLVGLSLGLSSGEKIIKIELSLCILQRRGLRCFKKLIPLGHY